MDVDVDVDAVGKFEMRWEQNGRETETRYNDKGEDSHSFVSHVMSCHVHLSGRFFLVPVPVPVPVSVPVPVCKL